MMGSGSSEKGELPSKWDSGKVGLKGPKILMKGCMGPETFVSDVYQFIRGPKDLTEIRILYEILEELNLELPKFHARVNNSPSG